MVEITKNVWKNWNPKEKKRNKAGECFIRSKTNGQWVKVYWRR